MRPYVFRSGDIDMRETQDEVAIECQVLNSGRIPANNIRVETNLFDINEEVTENNASKKYPDANDVAPEVPVLFPNNKLNLNHSIDLKGELGKRLWNDIKAGQVKLRWRIRYKSYGREHITIQTEQLCPHHDVSLSKIIIVGLQKWT